MRTKNCFVWGLCLASLVCQFTTVMGLKAYIAFYHASPMLGSVVAVLLVYLSVMVMLWAERYPHRWHRYAPLYLVFALIGLFVPGCAAVDKLAYGIVGILPLVLMSSMWTVKRYWTIRV